MNDLCKKVDICAVLALVLPLTLYLVTLAPTVTFFDSGEFITATASLGAAHSPGYPLFVNYAKPFTLLPFGSVAFRVNFATAFSAALACLGVYLLTYELLKVEDIAVEPRRGVLLRRLVALIASLTFAGTPRLWLQSNHDKPYPLLSFICAVVFLLILRWRDSVDEGAERPWYVYLGAFLCGLGTGAHQIIVLMIPSYAYLIISKDRRVVFRLKELLIAFAFSILGFSIHLHLIVRALQKPLLNWGDSKNLTQFMWGLLRKGYPVEKPVRDMKLLWTQVNAFNIPFEFTAVGLFLLLLGLVVTAKRSRDAVIAYLIGIISFLAVIAGYFNAPAELVFLSEEFFTPLYLLTAVFIGTTLFALLRVALQAGQKRFPRQAALQAGLVLLLTCFPAAICVSNFVENDQHENYIASDYASNTLRSLPQNAIMFTWGDSGAFPLWYLQGVERMREDVDLPHTPHLVFDWYLDTFPKLFAHSRLRQIPPEQLPPEQALLIAVAEQLPQRPVLVDFSTRYSVALNQYQLHQRGITFQLVPTSQPLMPPDLEVWQLYSLRGILGTTDMFFRDLDTGKAIQIYAAGLLESGESLLRLAPIYQSAGAAQLCLAKQITPDLAPQANQLLSSFGLSCPR